MTTAPDQTPRVEQGHRTPVITTTITAVFTALVFLSTYLFQIPIPATQGYFNLGDIMIFIAALTFGPAVGGFAGGVGSSLSDALGGFGTFAPFTLVIKGLEGFVAGLIAQRRTTRQTPLFTWVKSLFAWGVGSVIMVLGYFSAEWFLIPLVFGPSQFTGIVAATAEVPFNFFQVFAGGIVGIPVSLGVKFALRSTAFSSRIFGPMASPSPRKDSSTQLVG